MRIGEPRVLVVATSYTRLPLEILSAKEAKRRSDCGGKHLGCPRFFVNHGADGGLQCGLSGNRATESGGHFLMLPVWQRSVCGFNGKPPHRQRGVSAGEIRPDLSRKIYSVCRRSSSQTSLRYISRCAPDIHSATLLLLSNADPLRWARHWVWTNDSQTSLRYISRCAPDIHSATLLIPNS